MLIGVLWAATGLIECFIGSLTSGAVQIILGAGFGTLGHQIRSGSLSKETEDPEDK